MLQLLLSSRLFVDAEGVCVVVGVVVGVADVVVCIVVVC
jgi:hypothetical protein